MYWIKFPCSEQDLIDFYKLCDLEVGSTAFKMIMAEQSLPHRRWIGIRFNGRNLYYVNDLTEVPFPDYKLFKGKDVPQATIF